jgi:hypothetical protein
MAFDLNDFDLPAVLPDRGDSCRLADILQAVLESVAFHIYDENKINSIVNHVHDNLLANFGISLVAQLRWRPPKVTCQVNNLNLKLLD